ARQITPGEPAHEAEEEQPGHHYPPVRQLLKERRRAGESLVTVKLLPPAPSRPPRPRSFAPHRVLSSSAPLAERHQRARVSEPWRGASVRSARGCQPQENPGDHQTRHRGSPHRTLATQVGRRGWAPTRHAVRTVSLWPPVNPVDSGRRVREESSGNRKGERKGQEPNPPPLPSPTMVGLHSATRSSPPTSPPPPPYAPNSFPLP